MSLKSPRILELITTVGQFVRRVRAVSSRDLSFTEGAVIGHLARNGAATTAELARAQSMRPQSMGATIAALEELGMVTRQPHPTDGRQMHVVLTEKGLAARKTALAEKESWLSQAIARLDKRDQETLFAAVAVMKRLAEME